MNTNKETNYSLSYPAANNEVVTQGHVNWCEKYGHGKHTINGIVQSRCPRCDNAIGDALNEK